VRREVLERTRPGYPPFTFSVAIPDGEMVPMGVRIDGVLVCGRCSAEDTATFHSHKCDRGR
jgi:hypothetical protein